MKLIALCVLCILLISCSERVELSVHSDIEIVADNLNVPWEIDFLPDGDMIVTERAGNLIRIGEDRKVIPIDGVIDRGEGGLLGFALHPDFEQNQWIYLYFTSDSTGEKENRVERYYLNLKDNKIEQKKIIISGIPSALFHDGGRIRFGPDGYLYITTGDATVEELSQDTTSLAGKILRVDDGGDAVSDSPFGNEVYSYGHRNSQGIAWDVQGNLWATEHGRSGLLSGFDELNRIEKGKNYGWPIVQGDETQQDMMLPVIHSGADDTWAPSALVVLDERIFFVGLRGEALYEYNTETKVLKEQFKNQFGRLRTIAYRDDFLYIGTSNRDGRGSPYETDDRILKVRVDGLK